VSTTHPPALMDSEDRWMSAGRGSGDRAKITIKQSFAAACPGYRPSSHIRVDRDNGGGQRKRARMQANTR